MQDPYEKLKRAILRDKRPKASFRAWLMAQAERNDPTGDLARDFLANRVQYPERIPRTDHALVEYLKAKVLYVDEPPKMPAPEEVVDAAWMEWLGSR